MSKESSAEGEVPKQRSLNVTIMPS